MAFALKKIISAFIVPPLAFIWLALLGILMARKKKMLGHSLSGVSLILVLVLSTPFVSSRLIVCVQDNTVVTVIDPQAQAIVILGGGGASLERVQSGARLAKQTGLPILVSSGDPFHEGVTEASTMQEILKTDFGLEAQWREDRSRDTAENALFSFQVLQKENIKHIYLVTHATHMPRAKHLFETAGFSVVPAPTEIKLPKKLTWYNLLPSAEAFEDTSKVFREMIGGIWARRI